MMRISRRPFPSLFAILGLVVGLLAVACTPSAPPETQPPTASPADAERTAAPQGPASYHLPFHFVVEETDKALEFGIQSSAFAEWDGKWLFVGGRLQGFHLTFSESRTFPSKYSNDHFVVYDPATDTTHTAPLPDAVKVRLRSTNMEFVQDGEVLYTVGGYGSNCDADRSGCYETFPYLSAISLPNVIQAVMAGPSANQSVDLELAVVSIEDERFRVTGGILRKVGDFYYLVFGHNFHQIYKSARTGIYTEQVRRFKIHFDGTDLSISDYQAYSDPTGDKGTDSQYHRRDLNVIEGILNGEPALTAWGGVFTAEDLGWPHPVTIKPSAGADPAIEVLTGFSQKTNYYESAHLVMYDPSSDVTYTTLFGGITNWFYDGSGTLRPPSASNSLPFTNIVTTMSQSGGGSSAETAEHIQPFDQGLPALLGSNSHFVPVDGLPVIDGTHDVIDASKLPAADSDGRLLIGHMVSGIRATGAQSSGDNPTFAGKTIYAVYLVGRPGG